MRKHRFLAVIMAVIFILSGIPTAAYYADSIGTEAAACKQLGILIGADSTGVTSEYLATTPTRIQAYIIVLRLKGLYNDATGFDSSVNFPDASAAGWAKNYMAYAKSKPELGWVGMPDGSFAPNGKIDAKAFYKVMLETLGYKQGIDFAYNDTLNFAGQVGLIKNVNTIAAKKTFTVDDVAVGIYSALNTKTKEDGKKLISIMVEQQVISADMAISAGFTLDTKTIKVTSLKAVSNNKLELEFDDAIVVQKGDIEIEQLDGSSRLSVLSVSSQGSKAVITTTDAEPFKAYQVTMNTLVPTDSKIIRGYEGKYVALPRDNVKPTVKYEQVSSREFKVTFSEAVDKSSAESLVNYLIEHDVAVLSAQLADDEKTVTLKTTEITADDFYKITIQNVCDMSGNVMDRFSDHFDGLVKDTKNPEISDVESVNNNTVVVTFNERVSSSSTEKPENYSIDNGVTVYSSKLNEDEKSVTLSTSTLSSGYIYKLTASNVSDMSGNSLYSREYRFSCDSSRPTASVVALSGSEVMVTFNEKVEEKTAEDPDNYSISNNLQVIKASLDGSGKVVTLVTKPQTQHVLYTINISGVTDTWGNTMNSYSGKFGGMSDSNAALSFSVASKANYVVITFSKRVDEETAEDVFNYSFDNDLGYAATATLDTDASGRVVTLLTADQASGKIYSVTVKNVTDIAGNRISTDEKVCKKKFAGINTSGAGTANSANFESAVTVNVNTIDLMFDTDLTEDELDDLKVTVTNSDEDESLPSSLSYIKYFLSNKNTVRVQFKTSSSNNPELFTSGDIFEVKLTGVGRLVSAGDANIKQFAGTGIANEAPAIQTVEALNSTAVAVTFSEPVKGISSSQFSISNGVQISSVSVESSDITDNAIIYLRNTTQLDNGSTYKLTVKSGVRDAAGINSVTSYGSVAEFDGTSNDNDSPYIESDIELVNDYTMQIQFSEPVKGVGNSSFSIRKVSGDGGTQFSLSKTVLSDDKTTAMLYFNSRYSSFDSDCDYELSMNSSITDLQGLAIDSDSRKVEFSGTDEPIEALEIIASYINDDNDEITLITNKELSTDSLSMNYFQFDGADYSSSSSDKVKCSKNTITITLENELAENDSLTIDITSSGRSAIKDFNGQTLETEEVNIATH